MVAQSSPQLSEQAKPIRDLLSARMSDYGRATVEIHPVLAYLIQEERPSVSSDASSYGLGAVLKQPNGEVRPITYVYTYHAP